MREYQVSGFRVLEYEELDSTNNQAEKLGWNVLEDKMVVVTHRQTRGRGQVGNHWESEPGKNISTGGVVGGGAVCRFDGDCLGGLRFYFPVHGRMYREMAE